MVIGCPALTAYVEAALNGLDPAKNFGLGVAFMGVWKSVCMEY